MQVDVMQFLRPNGQQKLQTAEVPDICRDGYQAMARMGCRLTAEELTTGHVSLCIEDPGHGDFDGRLVANGPAVPGAIASMLLGFRTEVYEVWLRELMAQNVEQEQLGA